MFSEDCFNETLEALVHLGVNAERQGQIFRVGYIFMIKFQSTFVYLSSPHQSILTMSKCTPSPSCDLLQILAGILHLGNVNFCSSADESQPCDLEEQSKGIKYICILER